MRLARRLVGFVSGTAGLIGLLLGVAGLGGVWVGYTEVMRRVTDVFDRADQGLAGAQGNLSQATNRLRRTEADLLAVREREADLAARPPVDRPARREATRKALDTLGPGVAEARSTLVKATEAALVANGLLEALAELPGVERVNVDPDQLKEAAVRLDDLTEKSTRLTDLLARAGPATGDEVASETSRAVHAVRKPIALAEAGSERLESGRQSIGAAHDRLVAWIKRIAAALAVILLWVTAGQLSLLIHGWKLVRP
jgi:hypothetical protein